MYYETRHLFILYPFFVVDSSVKLFFVAMRSQVFYFFFFVNSTASLLLPLDCAPQNHLVLFYQRAGVLYWLQAYVYIFNKTHIVCLIKKKKKKNGHKMEIKKKTKLKKVQQKEENLGKA